MNNSALIVFVKNPILGKVKTRLAKDVGDEQALAIYERLLEHTESVVRNTAVDKYVFYSDKVDELDIWPADIYNKTLQVGSELGQRMLNAFDELFDDSYKKVVIIGSDCAEITPEIIEAAYVCLDKTDMVIGPANDGGYYLLGMNKTHQELFEGVEWGASTVLATTMDIARTKGLSCSTLQQLSDVDELVDVPKSWL